ncbi:MAG: DUF1552 domain-containing protein [Bdellovibrionota bacterium]
MNTSRRKFLGGAGGIVSLPFLESLLPRSAWANQADVIQRFVAYYVPNGRHGTAFRPTQNGRNFDLPPTLSPLMPLKDYLTVITGLTNQNVVSKTVTCDHAKAAGPSLTGMPILNGSVANLGTSIDQHMVQQLKLATQFPSLQWTAAEPGVPDCGATTFYTQCISWKDAKTPLSPLASPQAAFNQLFAGYDANATAAQRALREATQKSVLDFVVKDVKSLAAKMNPADKTKVDEYLTGVRDIERRMTTAGSGMCGKNVPTPPPSGVEHPARVKLFNDLMVLALKCDMTRVITFMLEFELSYRIYEFLLPGQGSAGHHSLSHFGGNKTAENQLLAIEKWETTMILDLAEKLKATPEGDGNLLDNTILCYMPGMGHGDAHDHANFSMAILGKGAGKINAGQHMQRSGVPKGNLNVSLLNAMGVKTERFGMEGSANIEGLLLA